MELDFEIERMYCEDCGVNAATPTQISGELFVGVHAGHKMNYDVITRSPKEYAGMRMNMKIAKGDS